ncbi:hypothetical protein dqs_0617 [Azoarcus olearius]|uniref:hypothetical protein n=1 Tax=Azoarcus sp. (strain BH72) TaxID=418699 RepID=UPI0008063090|nr:hypothetical protein [Azoarcus olearius]ANQ83693.1 hypothetical protein dqs_0617 [Azoarcus olearius]
MDPSDAVLKPSDWLSIIAIVVSLLSFIVSLWVAMRDRAIVEAQATAVISGDSGEYYVVVVRAANVGKRPIALRTLWGTYTNGCRSGFDISANRAALSEYGAYEERVHKFDGFMVVESDDGTFADLVDLYFEDTGGGHHRVKGAKEAIALVRGSKHPFGMR